jgi:hypothetical protein
VSSWQSPPPNPSPYAPSGPAHFAPPPQPPKKSLLWLWILLGVGGLGSVCCVGGVVGIGLFGLNIVAAEVADQIRDEPEFREHIGELQSLDFDFVATSAKNDDETFVYNAKGDKGSGVLTVKQTEDENWNNVIVEASLRLPDGRQVQVVP